MKKTLSQYSGGLIPFNSLQINKLTKLLARANTLAHGIYALKHDPNFMAAKKLSTKAKEQKYLEYKKAAEKLFNKQVSYVDKSELKEE